MNANLTIRAVSREQADICYSRVLAALEGVPYVGSRPGVRQITVNGQTIAFLAQGDR